MILCRFNKKFGLKHLKWFQPNFFVLVSSVIMLYDIITSYASCETASESSTYISTYAKIETGKVIFVDECFVPD